MAMCRACVTTETGLNPIDLQFVESFNLLTGIRISLIDGLYVCKTCRDTVQCFIDFRDKCIEADLRFQGMVAVQESKLEDGLSLEYNDYLETEIKEEENIKFEFLPIKGDTCAEDYYCSEVEHEEIRRNKSTKKRKSSSSDKKIIYKSKKYSNEEEITGFENEEKLTNYESKEHCGLREEKFNERSELTKHLEYHKSLFDTQMSVSGSGAAETLPRSRSPVSPSRSPHSLQESCSSPRAPSYSPVSRRGTPSPIILIEVPPDNVLPDHEYQTPNNDPLFVPPSDSAMQSSRSRSTPGGSRSVRGGRPRGRGHVGGRADSRGQVGARVASSAQHIWTTGDPIIQVCVTDEDVPASLRQNVDELIETRAQRDSRLAATTARRASAGQHEEEDDNFFDAEDEEVDAVLLGGRDTFDWQPMSSFQAQREVFTPPRAGSVETHDNIYDAFRSFWPLNILEHIVVETNRYARQIISPGFRRDWYDTNVHEILVLFSFWMMLGIIKLPTIKSCFTTNALLKTNVFRKMFSQRRYVHLIRALHFVNNSDRAPNDSRLFCFGPILNHLNEAFKNNYIPGPQVSIDESLTLWKGVLNFRQYIKTKAAKFGIKTFELCDSVTGYLWSFTVYVGKDTTTPTPILKSTSVVLDLIRPLLNKGYCLFMDNWFNSPTLARYLKGKNTDCVGTLRPSRCGVPPLLQQAVLQKGQLIARHCGDVAVLAWQDKKKVLMISTFHDASTALVSNSHVTQSKPQVVLDYNKYMGGVDLKDQMLEPYLLERKKWYMKLFRRLVNASILNSRILLESSSGRRIDHLSCRLRLVETILEKHLQFCPCKTNPSETDPLARMETRHVHWPVRIPGTDSKNRQLRKRCINCLKNRKPEQKTPFKCEYCDTPLCIEPCFKAYHGV